MTPHVARVVIDGLKRLSFVLELQPAVVNECLDEFDCVQDRVAVACSIVGIEIPERLQAPRARGD